jgi:hypothetical protein
MSRRLLATLIALATIAPWSAAAAFAQTRTPGAAVDLTLPSVRVMAVDAVLRGEIDQRSFPVAPAPRQQRSSPIFGSLYATTAVMQALDVHSTMLALDRGAVEANPLMSGVTRNKAAFIATKAAVATGTILAARSLSKRNKVAAVITLVALNTAYGFIVQNNYRVARGLK